MVTAASPVYRASMYVVIVMPKNRRGRIVENENDKIQIAAAFRIQCLRLLFPFLTILASDAVAMRRVRSDRGRKRTLE